MSSQKKLQKTAHKKIWFHSPSQNDFKWILKHTKQISFTMLSTILEVVLH